MAVLNRVAAESKYRQWQSDLARWHCDVGFWRQEYQKALADLKRLEEALRAREKSLQVHAERLAAHEAFLAALEHGAEDLPDGGADEWGRYPPGQQEAARHSRQRDAHELIKRGHHTLMAYWSLLLETLGKAV
jgi:septal ring factor EnvC (AmiA/AmiB activator)